MELRTTRRDEARGDVKVCNLRFKKTGPLGWERDLEPRFSEIALAGLRGMLRREEFIGDEDPGCEVIARFGRETASEGEA